MRIKHHPATIVEIYPDGHVEAFLSDPVFRFDGLKIRLIKGALEDTKDRLAEKMPCGTYRMYLSHYRWLKRPRTKFTLKAQLGDLDV